MAEIPERTNPVHENDEVAGAPTAGTRSARTTPWPRNRCQPPVDPNTLVRYQPGAIVSRTVLERERDGDGIRLRRGSGSESTARPTRRIQVLDGTALVQFDGTERTIDAGEAIRLPAGVPHAVEAPERMRMLLTMLR